MSAADAPPGLAGASERSPALKHAVLARCSTSSARVCSLELPHNTLELPIFMPVGTVRPRAASSPRTRRALPDLRLVRSPGLARRPRPPCTLSRPCPVYVCAASPRPRPLPRRPQAAAVKGLTVEEMEALEVPLILGNTYHLALRPTTKLLDECGGLHKFMGWRRAMLTDSGGFQMVSLLKLANITEEGVTFQSPSDGSKMLLTPEKSMQLQNEIGADIMMALDDVVSSTTPSRERVEEAMHRTLRWIDRCIAAHSRPTAQNLFGIVQVGLPLLARAPEPAAGMGKGSRQRGRQRESGGKGCRR